MKLLEVVIVLGTLSVALADSSIAESRLFFPVLSAFNSIGYPKSYPAPSKPSYYPPARPSKGQYSPPRPPSSSYGAPKPSYPAPSASYPAPSASYPAPSASYPAPSASYPVPKPSYGVPKPANSYTYKPSTGYHPSTTRAPIYFTTETPVTYPSYPKPGYQPDQQWTPGPVFVFIPKPQYPSTAQQPINRPPVYPASSYPAPPNYPVPKPSYPSPSYPDAKPSYLPPAKPSYSAPKPSYPAPNPSYPKPTYPATAAIASYPKPGYPVATNYPAPSPSYEAPKPSYPAPSYPVPSYPTPKPQVYPQPYPIKPAVQYPATAKPSTSYGPPKPYEGAHHPAYEVPRPIAAPPDSNYRAGSTQPPAIYGEPLVATSAHNATRAQIPSYVVGVLPDYDSSNIHPQVFQRGNGQPQHFHSAGSFAAPTTEGSSVQSTLFRQQVESVTPRSVWWSPGSKHNDCGGPWVILGDHPPDYDSSDPSQIQISPIGAPSTSVRGRDQSGRSPLDPAPQNNELTWPPVFYLKDLKPTKSENHSANQFFLLASPTTATVSSAGSSSSTSIADEESSVAFKALPILPVSPSASASNQSITSGSLFIDSVTGPNTPTIKVLSSTENTIIFSRNKEADEEAVRQKANWPQLIDIIGTGVDDVPSPFLGALTPDLIADDLPVSITEADGDQEADKSGRNVQLTDWKSPDAQTDNSLSNGDWEVDNYTSAVTGWLARANLKALAYWLELADIATLLQPDQEYTLMAPSNVAFSQVSSRDRRHWRDHQDRLRQILLYHIVPGRLTASSLINEGRPSTLAGSQHPLRINVYNGTDNQRTLTVNGARILTPDLSVEPSRLLTVHVIDLVLNPVAQQTILDILEQGGLHSAILGPTLSSTLASATALTVFLPTTEAFLQIGQDQQLALLHNDTAFHRLLWYHVVPGTHYSQGMEDGQVLTSLRDIGKLKLSVQRQGRRKSLLAVNGAKVLRSDVSASNGVIHFIDRILTDILL